VSTSSVEPEPKDTRSLEWWKAQSRYYEMCLQRTEKSLALSRQAEQYLKMIIGVREREIDALNQQQQPTG
jgi:hypothetical protein